MTRVTNDLRQSMERAIMADLPVVNYVTLIRELVQKTVIAHAPEQVRVMYDDPDLRKYLKTAMLEVKLGNAYVNLHPSGSAEVYGLKDGRFTVRMDDAENPGRLLEGTLYRDVVIKLHESGLVTAYFTQEDLRLSVRKRLNANLAASTTFKQLYANLEPELHHYIPKDEVKARVPACVAPVVDDLRKLGADLPAVPKAAG